MQSSTYNQLRKRLAAESLFEPSNLYGGLTVFLNLAVVTACAVVLVNVPRFSWGYWLCELLLGLSTFRFYAMLHDCGHGTLFKQHWLNTWVGHLVSPLSFYPLASWRHRHITHHQWAGIVGKDPDVPEIKILQQNAGLYRMLCLCWHYWLPVPLAHHIITNYWLYPLSMFKQGKGLWRSWFSLFLMLLPHGIALLLAPLLYLIYVVPALLIGLVWLDLLTMPLHLELAIAPRKIPLPYRQHHQVTRNLRLPGAISFLLLHNFNLHVEHHWFPDVPWYRLPRIQQVLKNLEVVSYQQAHPLTYLATARQGDPAVAFRARQSVI